MYMLLRLWLDLTGYMCSDFIRDCTSCKLPLSSNKPSTCGPGSPVSCPDPILPRRGSGDFTQEPRSSLKSHNFSLGISHYQWNCRKLNFLLLLWNHQLLVNGWKQTVTKNDYCTMARRDLSSATDRQIDFEDWAKSDSLERHPEDGLRPCYDLPTLKSIQTKDDCSSLGPGNMKLGSQIEQIPWIPGPDNGEWIVLLDNGGASFPQTRQRPILPGTSKWTAHSLHMQCLILLSYP